LRSAVEHLETFSSVFLLSFFKKAKNAKKKKTLSLELSADRTEIWTPETSAGQTHLDLQI